MEKLKEIFAANKKPMLVGLCTFVIVLLLLLGLRLMENPKKKAYYYENKIEAMLAQRTIDYLDQHVVMKEDALNEMGDMAVKTYNTILTSGTEDITDEHSAAVEGAISDALYLYLTDENLSETDYEALAAGISKIIWDTLLTELVNSDLAINVSYREEFNELTAGIQEQIADIEERMAKLKVNATIKFNTQELENDINQAISSALEEKENKLYSNLENEISDTVEKQLSEKEKELAGSINNDINKIKESMTKEIISEVSSKVQNGKDGVSGKNGTDGRNGKSTYIAYADDNKGSGFSLTPTETSKYIGTCITESTTQPTYASAYSNWQPYRSYLMEDVKKEITDEVTNEVQSKVVNGKDGNDGKSTYIAYAEDTKGKGFSLTPTETTKYIGTCITDAADQPKTVDSYSNWQPYRSYIMTVTTDEHGEATLHIR